MSFRIRCPNCGSRPVDEFSYGGEVRGTPPDGADAAEWFGYVYERSNIAGPQVEWWSHLLGCQLWFLVERDTTTNQVMGSRRADHGSWTN